MERRARVLRRIAEKIQKSGEETTLETQEEAVHKLKNALEDCTAVCILEGFQKQEHMMLVDAILKELGKPEIVLEALHAMLYKSFFKGRAEAKLASIKRPPVLSSSNFIRQYFQSFAEDPIMSIPDSNSTEESTNGESNGYHKS